MTGVSSSAKNTPPHPPPPPILHPNVAGSLRRTVIKASSSSSNDDDDNNSYSIIFKGKSPSTILLSKFMSLLPTTILEKHTISASFPFLSQIVVVQQSKSQSSSRQPSPSATTPRRLLSLVHHSNSQHSSPLWDIDSQAANKNSSNVPKQRRASKPLQQQQQQQPLLSCFAVKANKQSDHGRIGAVIYGTGSFRHSEASRVEIWIRQESRKMQKAAINLPFYRQQQDGGFPSFNVSFDSSSLAVPSPSEAVSTSPVCLINHQGRDDTTIASSSSSSSSAHVQSMIDVLLNNGDYRAVSSRLFQKNQRNNNKMELDGGNDNTRTMNLACPKDPTAVLEAGYGPLWCRPCKHRTSNCKNV